MANANFTLGTTNYNDGGIEYNIRARATSTGNTQSAYAFEAAYRSVLVFSKQNAVAGAGNLNQNDDTNIGGGLNRIWIRGGNTTAGSPTIPDFPISRDGELWQKVKLLTPISGANFTATGSTVTHANIFTGAIGNGDYLWFWVTWRINVPAFVDLHVGTLPPAAGDTYGTYPAPRGNIRQLYKAYVPGKEHYAVHPGRTTVVENRFGDTAYRFFHDGEHGNPDLTSAVTPLPPRDLDLP